MIGVRIVEFYYFFLVEVGCVGDVVCFEVVVVIVVGIGVFDEWLSVDECECVVCVLLFYLWCID